MACLELRKKNIKCIVYAGISRADGFRNFKTRPNENTQGQRSAWKAQISMAIPTDTMMAKMVHLYQRTRIRKPPHNEI